MDNPSSEKSIELPYKKFIQLYLGSAQYRVLGEEDKWLWEKCKELDTNEAHAHYDMFPAEGDRKRPLYTIWNLLDWQISDTKSNRLKAWSEEQHQRRIRKEEELAKIKQAIINRMNLDPDMAQNMASMFYHKKMDKVLETQFGITGIEFGLEKAT